MQDRWNDAEAEQFVARYAEVGRDVALRLYTSRLLGAEPRLVLHGGGNTSVKTRVTDRLGRETDVLCVKGSGADLAALLPAGLPAVELEPLRRLRALDALDDETMVVELRRRLLDPAAPDPSVEALLHAFLPHRFVDHTHADAILALSDQPDGERHVRDALGADVAVLPWIMPGFPLAKAVAAAFEAQPDCVGVVLLQHGLFTFGDTAQQSYARTIALVAAAERHLERTVGAVPPMLRGDPAPLPPAERRALLRTAVPLLRGVLAFAQRGEGPRMVAEIRCDDALASFAAHPDAAALCATGPVTPDHVIRTRGRYLFLRREQVADRGGVEAAVRDWVAWYTDYFERCAKPRGADVMLYPMPVVAVIEGAGVVALQPSRKAARVAADVAAHTLPVKAQGHALGAFTALPEDELAAMEYWPLELKKLGKGARPPLAGHVALVTGGAGAIGCGVAQALLEAGACVLLTDRDDERLRTARERLQRHREHLHCVAADLTDGDAVARVLDECVLTFGGVDVVVPSAGVAHVARLEELDAAAFERVLAVNATATMRVLQEAAKVLRAQGTGGTIVLQASKNAFAPGAGFGAYSASKAAALQLGRVAALEFAEFGVRVNMINADAVFGDDEVPSQLWAEVGPERMRARGLDPAGLRAFYRDRNLLKTTVTPRHVGAAVVFLATQATATTGAVLPIDGGLPEAFPR